MKKHTTNPASHKGSSRRFSRLLFLLGRSLQGITDPRDPRGVRYPLRQILAMVVLAKAAGQDTPFAIAQWVAERRETLSAILGLKQGRTPHHTTFHRVLRRLPKEQVEAAVRSFTLALAQDIEHNPHTDQILARLLVFDGKTLRGTHLAQDGTLHLLGAYWPWVGGSLGQVQVNQKKENEIRQARPLLSSLPLAGKIVIGDALHTQRTLSAWLRKHDAHFIWFVKENHKRLYRQLRNYFTWLDQQGRHLRLDSPQWEEAQTAEKNRGRLETRHILVSAEALEGVSWPGGVQAFCLISRRRKPGGTRVEEERRYGLTSLSPREASAETLLQAVRMYWRIENSLHYRRDVTFQEDKYRTRWATLGQVMAALNNLLITFFNQFGFTNHAQARRWFDAHWRRYALSLRLGLAG